MHTKTFFAVAVLALTTAVAPHVLAAGQSSANYAIRADSVNNGVDNASSANFTLGSTVGEIGSVSQTTSALFTINGGFRAQVNGAAPTGNQTISVAVSGSGSVASNPAGISCPGTCSAAFASANVTLTASPTAGSILQSFTGCDSTTGLTCTILPLTAPRNVAIAFIVSAATVPGAPTIGTAIPGNAQATINFTPPASNGGSAILGYRATCAPGGIVGNGNGTSLNVAGLANGTLYTCSVVAINGVGAGPASGNVTVTPVASALTLQQVVSRKTHGATPFDIDIDRAAAISGNITVEPRIIGLGHSIVFVFDAPVTAAGSVSVVDSNTNSIGTATVAASGNSVVVTLTGVVDNKRVTVSIFGVNGSGGGSAAIGFLVGDVNGTRSVSASDISAVKARSGQGATALNFKFDVNATGAISASDISAVKARSGLVLAP